MAGRKKSSRAKGRHGSAARTTAGAGRGRAPRRARARKVTRGRGSAPAARRRPTAGPSGAGRPRDRDRAAPRLEEIAEAVSIMLPELSARLAALEHLLIERRLCARQDLSQARAFVDLGRTHL